MQAPSSPARLTHPPDQRDLFLLSGVILMFWMSLYVYVPILPVYAETVRGASLPAVGLIVASYGFTQLLLRMPLGFFSDRIGRRRPFVMLGLVLSLASALGMAAARSPGMLVVLRGSSGVAAATWVACTVWFASFFPPQRAVRATGLATFLGGLGQVLATSGGGALAQALGWQAPFYTSALVALAGLTGLLLVVERRPPGGSRPPAAGIRAALSSRTLLTVSLAAAVGQYVAYATTYGFIPIYAASLGATRAQLGWLTSGAQLTYVVASMLVSVLSNPRIEKHLAWAGLALMGVASLAVPASSSVPGLLLNRGLHGFGLGLSYPVLMGLAIQNVPSERRALSMGIFQAIYALGMFAGPALSGWAAEAGGVSSVFWISGVLTLGLLPFFIPGLLRAARPVRAIQQDPVETV